MAENMLMGSAVSLDGYRPKQYDNFIYLKKIASKAELESLTNHSNPVVRCYAFWALSFKSHNLFSFVFQHLSDTQTVQTFFGCIRSRQKVGDFFGEVVRPNYIDLDNHKLSAPELSLLDSLLLYTQNNLEQKYWAIERIEKNEAHYPRLRELALRENNHDALVALASYQKKEDVPIIRDFPTGATDKYSFFYAYKAMKNFPHPAFLPFLKSQLLKAVNDSSGHYDSDWSLLYQAIAAYKDSTAAKLLALPFTITKDSSMRKYHYDYVFGAASENLYPVYNDLLWKFWEQESYISSPVFGYLLAVDPKRSLNASITSLLRPDKFFWVNGDAYDFDGHDTVKHLTAILLDFVLTNDRKAGYEIIRRGISEAGVLSFPFFSDKAVAITDSSFIAPLLNRLATEDNGYVFSKIVGALLRYNNPKIDKQLFVIYQKNKALRDSWDSKGFRRMLLTHKLN